MNLIIQFFAGKPLRVLMALITISASLYILFRVPTFEQFPSIPAGSYVGRLEFAHSEAEPLWWYVESTPEFNQLFLAVLANGWEPQVLTSTTRGIEGKDAHDDSGGPLMVPVPNNVLGSEKKMMLAGGRKGENRFRGTFVSLKNSYSGTWTLEPIGAGRELESGDELRQWLLHFATLQRLAKEKAGVIKERTVVDDSIAELERSLSDREGFTAETRREISSENDKLREVRTHIEEEDAKRRALAEEYRLALRLSPEGKLVTLSRESLARESDWIMAKLLHAEAEKDGAALQENRRSVIERAIQAEKSRISSLRDQIGQGMTPHPDSEAGTVSQQNEEQ